VQTEVLDLDGSVVAQSGLMERYRPRVYNARDWGPRLRLNCAFSRLRVFEQTLRVRTISTAEPTVTFCGSGDFHHVSLALVRRITEPFNLLVVDNHPDWMRGWPALHCGTWLYHAAQLPLVQHIFHVGGDVDFDNYYRGLAPWRLLDSGKIVVIPAVRRYRAGRWARVAAEPLREQGQAPVCVNRLQALLRHHRTDLARAPLYISFDKDVLRSSVSVVNWDSGHLELTEAVAVLEAFVSAARGRLAGMDVVGDWSPVVLRGWLRRFFHLAMHPPLTVDPHEAARVNERTNLHMLECMEELTRTHSARETCA
jgi:hypothetical protein